MEDLSRIRARIESMQELGELVGALRSMAASRTREAQESLAGTRGFREVIERAIAEVSLLLPESAQPLPGGNGPGRRALLVIASENGFVGLFNARLIEHALSLRQPEEELMICGRRGQITAAERGIAETVSFPMTSRVQGVTALARRIAQRLSGLDAARIVFARPRPGATFEVEVRPVLPLRDIPAAAAPTPPVLHMPPAALLAQLSSEYLFAEIAHALMENLASENGARMRAMDAASRNISDRIEVLRRNERVARQEKTTTELLDVVTGAEAVTHD